MKRILLSLSVLTVIFLAGCGKKDDNPGGNPTPPLVPSFSVQSVTYPTLTNSTWSNVIGGEVDFEFDLLNSAGSVSSTLKDSTDLTNIGSYLKTLSSGNYNVLISSSDQNAVADTFIRFNAEVKDLSVTNHEAASFTATTTDGLITIGQSFVKAGNIPVFKPSTGSASYKFGLANGFYYLYVAGGTQGSVVFTAQSGNQTAVLTKNLAITTLNQSNLAVQASQGTFQVVIAPFTYNQVQVSSSTLMTVNMNPNDVIANMGPVYFVVTDASGNILNSVQYVKGTSTFKISSLNPYTGTRFNFYEVYVPTSTNEVPGVIGFLQVKKGSTYNSDLPYLPQMATSPLTVHLANTTSFDQLAMSTDLNGGTISSIADSTNLQSFSYPAGSQLFVEALRNNQYSYGFISIPSGTSSMSVDITKLTETPQVQTVTCPGNNLYISLLARTDTNYSNFYYLGSAGGSPSQLNFYYPIETFEQLYVREAYYVGNLNYTTFTAGNSIPAQAAPAQNASFTVQGTTAANFSFTPSGTYNYYHAQFASTAPYVDIDVYSPSAANYNSIKLPDFSKYFGFQSLNLSTIPLTTFSLYQAKGFDEQSFFYPWPGQNFETGLIVSENF